MNKRRSGVIETGLVAALALALLASACTGQADATAGIAERELAKHSRVIEPNSSEATSRPAPAPQSRDDRRLAPMAGGTTGIGYDDGTLWVEAGEPGSIRLVDNPGSRTIGRRVACTWHTISGFASLPTWDRGTPVIPEPGLPHVLRCFHPDDGSDLTGYPVIVVYTPGDPIAGNAVGIVEVGRFAVDSIRFDAPVAALSPPGRQIVGIPTWLGVVSRLGYPDAAAQAGNTWARVRPVLRNAVWDMGDGNSVRCVADIDTLWDPGIAPASQSTTCVHLFEQTSGAAPLAGSVEVSWTIYEQTDRTPDSWNLWGVVRRRSPVDFIVGELQAVIR